MKRQKQDRTLELTAMQSPRRVAVPVIVRDGKNCVGNPSYQTSFFTGYPPPPPPAIHPSSHVPPTSSELYMSGLHSNGIRAW